MSQGSMAWVSAVWVFAVVTAFSNVWANPRVFVVRSTAIPPGRLRTRALVRRDFAGRSVSKPRGTPPSMAARAVIPGLVLARVEKFDRRGTEPIELLNIRIRAEILSEFRKFCQNSSEIQKFEDLSTFSKLFIEILRNSH